MKSVSMRELYELHREKMCANCKNKNCDGIHIAIDNSTRCDEGINKNQYSIELIIDAEEKE